MSIYKCKFEPTWKFICVRDHTSLTSPHEENTFELLHLLLVSKALKIFVSKRMKYTSYTHKFSNITNFSYNKRLVVIFRIFRYVREWLWGLWVNVVWYIWCVFIRVGYTLSPKSIEISEWSRHSYHWMTMYHYDTDGFGVWRHHT